ncbi:hypothetical protein DFH07DRAFT_408097 [Mycena maculata]|uniref:Uncharacterized protein n=1 Tax=Mycena maculata TaxID=230809 RepID=A0AAD7JDF1_9AGAR|nr:hypothetical protein DFH07DRAFT_408097 [Mycena maculata]
MSVSSSYTPSGTLIESVSFSTTTTTSFFTSNGQIETTTMPITVIAFATLVPYLPSSPAPSATSASPSQTKPPPLPILPIAVAVGGGGLVALILAAALYVFLRRRRRRPVRIGRNQPQTKLCLNTVPLETLDSPLAHEPNNGSRTFSRLTFSAPYVIPHSPVSPSTAAPSTVSIRQQYQYHSVPGGDGRR